MKEVKTESMSGDTVGVQHKLTTFFFLVLLLATIKNKNLVDVSLGP